MDLLPSFDHSTGRPDESGVGPIGYGGCTSCGRPKLEGDVGVVNTHVQFYGEGIVMFCAPCAGRIGALVGMLPAQRAAALTEELEATKEALANAEGTIADWRPLVESVIHLRTKTTGRRAG